ncbi:AAA family ATPase [Psychrobacter urativorans]|uniref:AAA family ATPase n=1 Tax=Psychrobacter urativorans TaxID=45610 RepID=UPI00191A8C3F|nr:AAA family ATPase [Psychrobacter urativorans]
MKIVKLHIDNFRGFVSTDINLDEKFNVIVGKNDVGKSTILEAFEIFFNNSTVKIDLDDLCKFSDEDYVEIGVSFKLDNFDLRII